MNLLGSPPRHSLLAAPLRAAALLLALTGCSPSDGGDGSPDSVGSSLFHLDAPSVTTHEEFDSSQLGQGWESWDGYAEAFPSDTANHAQFAANGSHLSVSFPGGAEHNQWWLRHAQVTKSFEGSAIYETKMDTGINRHQFGLVFESAPGTFLMFMLYGNGQVWGYVERFVTVNGTTHKTTLPGPGASGYETGFPIPDSGPYYLRVTVRDDDDPTQRFWKFQWSRDRQIWGTIVSGALEGAGATENIGAIESVGVFAGNHPPSPFTGLDAQFDYYKVYPVELSGSAGDGEASLAWLPIAGANGYRVYRSTVDGGPYTLVDTTTETSFVDQGLQNGVTHHYVVTSFDGSPAVGYSPQLSLRPEGEPEPPAAIPANGLALVLDASTLLGLADNDPVSTWVDSSGSGHDASGSGNSAPKFLSAGLNGQPALEFDGVNDYLQLAAGFDDFRDGVTIYAVARPTVLQSGFKLLALGNGAGNNNIVLGRAGTSGGLQYFTTNSSNAYGWFNTTGGLSAGDVAVFGVTQPGGAANSLVTATVTVNGESAGSGSVYVPPVTTRSVNYIGRSYWPEGLFQGELAEVIVYDRALSGAEHSQVREYLEEKYQLSQTQPEPLAPPSAVEAIADTNSVTVSYDAVPGATGYGIYRAGSETGPYTLLATTSDLTYVDGAVVAGNTYYYTVTATEAGDESAPSAPVSATVSQEPEIPPGLPATGLTLLLDAATISVGNGAAVTSWSDGSGQGHHATGVGGPTFATSGLNGHPAVTFDGVNDHLTLAAGFNDFTTGMTLFIVAEPTELTNGFKLFALGNGPSVDNIVLGRAGSSAGLQYFTQNASNGVGWFNSGDVLSVGTPSVFGVHQPGGNANASVTAKITLDGAEVGSGSVYVPRVVSRGVNYIGKSYWTEGYFKGRIAEVVLYSRQLSATERSSVQAYLEDKYELSTTEPEPEPVPVPTSVQAVADADAITVSYGAVTGATGYRIYRSEAQNGAYSQIANTTGTSYEDASVTPGVTYYYVVTATVGGQESDDSAVVSATVALPTPPPAPTEIPASGLALLLDASTLGLSNGSPVSTWSDGSGLGRHASGVGGPAFSVSGLNGQPAVEFDGINDHFTLPSGFSDFTAGVTLFVVAQPTVLQNGFKVLALGNGPGLDNIVLGRAGSSSGLQYFTNNSSNGVGWFNTASGLAAGDASVFGLYQAGGSVNSSVSAVVTVDGASVGSGSVFVPRVANRGVNYIGKSYWSEGYFQGRIAEIILYSRQLSGSERTAVHAYLADKYAM